ncbi:MAG: CPBP family intramembrane metalloprotease [Gemmatimonadota bacterium]|nr:MAG: CPBP family intramembrane metalloprotease [Gemmatimonadota bacterium]
MPRNKLGELLAGNRWLDALSIVVVLAPALAKLLLIASGALDRTGAAAERFAWWGIVAGMLMVWFILWSRGDGPSAIGLGRPTSWPRTILLALVVMVGATVVALLAQQLAAPLTDGRGPDISRFDRVRGNPGVLVVTLLSVWFNSAFGEELIWRGFLLTRLTHVLGGSRGALWGSVAISSVLFGLVHVYQGLAGVVTTGVIGLVFCVFFVLVRRNLWVLIIAHGLMHLMSFTAMYFGRL